MKIGLKMYYPSEMKEAGNAIKECDFLEFMAVEGTDYSSLKGIGLPITLHCEHESFGVNFANPKAAEKNCRALEFALETARLLDSETIVVHPGNLEGNDCSLKNSTGLIQEFGPKRLFVENMPCINFQSRLCLTPEDCTEYLKSAKTNFCLDFAHAAETAAVLGKESQEFIEGFLKLKPKYFHLCDSLIEGKQFKSHLHFGEGNLPLEKFAKAVPKNSKAAIETWNHPEKSLKDIEFLRQF